MYTPEQEMELVSNLLYAIGIDIAGGNNILVDQDTGNFIVFEGKNIKASRDPKKPVYISDNDIKLEPANPKCTKLVKSLFNMFLAKEEEMGEIPHVLSYYFDDFVEEVKKTARTTEEVYYHKLVIKFEDGTYYNGNKYRNKGLGYCEAILGIDGSFPQMDMRVFDDGYNEEK